MAVQESGEMYLETILILSQKSDRVRAIDVGEALGYSKPSVSRAMGLLRGEGLIEVDDAGYITLTKTGKEHAESIYDRHTTLTRIFQLLGVSDTTASEDACRIEHYISEETFLAIKEHLRRFDKKK